MSAYRLTSPFERPPLRRRMSGLLLALAVNAVLALAVLWLGWFPHEERKTSQALVVDFLPESHAVTRLSVSRVSKQPVRKPPPVVIPTKPTIAAPPPAPAPEKPLPFIPVSKADMAAGEIGSMAKSSAAAGDNSDIVGRGPHGEVLYAAEWARRPTGAEMGGYLPRNAPDGFGLVACKTIEGNRVEDCVELDQTPGSRLASAVRQAAWQFRVRPPRKNGVPLIGSWVRIRIEFNVDRSDRSSASPWSR